MHTNPLTGRNQLFQTPHSRWLALTHRDPSSHSSFLYGVKSTKIYCRPTCPARLARRANVVFYDTQEQARRDGFRPCKRCRPDNAGFVGVAEEIVSRVIALVRVERDSYDDNNNNNRGNDELTMMKRSLKDLAHEVGVTPSYLCRVFKKRMGVTIGTYMMEFEREEGGETEVGKSGNALDRSFHDTPKSARNPALAPQILDGGLVETSGMQNGEEALDLNFDFDEWFWAEEFVNDRVIECAV
ncbi:hypothetical protein UA08_02490 [Talaromyces atroroseus]|uniref:HTH araC/xylS-type domain-containing protein n=1 Tax=Talaromyces atroroseus TaxID=1441469 RepID=A0A225AQP3_TALAT|nr:hypothetical protein UA08_02490 [Talaromyces atroroseus]OKL61823.1 hypothetical protein UA08_02490 [Talaromyces atroroseus]